MPSPRRSSLALLAVLAAACSSGDSKPSPLSPAPVAERGLTIFPQHAAVDDDDGSPFPGVANYWDLDTNFSLNDGYDDQFDGALELFTVDLPADTSTWTKDVVENALWASVTTQAFPYDQTYGELGFETPALGDADGVVRAVVTGDAWSALAGAQSAVVAPGSGNVLAQALDLRSATAPITLSMLRSVCPNGSYMDTGGAGDFGARYEVRVIAGGTATVLEGGSGCAGGTLTASLDAFAGQQVTLEVYLRSMLESGLVFDEVSVKDASGAELVANGDFETGALAPWAARGVAEPFSVKSGARTVSGLSVTRAFSTRPSSLWARWVDVFENPGTTPVTTNVVYYTDLGSDGDGFVYPTPGAAGAVTSWDAGATWRDRDVAIVSGPKAKVFYRSVSALLAGDGEDEIYAVHPITVPAGGRVTIVQFVLMNGHDTGSDATDLTARATELDAAAAAIVRDFARTTEYRDYMAPEAAASIVNW